ncbi:unnamed protein product [Oikopleura dioica]|uniref:Uncharacterized protein n=1 Tax=Oikopleura dioica TaxID=34765 RepID=E4X7I3_OIKDI|nr:unnamed protein product [Oikopleura dioica]
MILTHILNKQKTAFADLSNLSVLALAQLSVQNQQAQNQPPNTGFTSTANTGGLFSNTNNTSTGGGLFGNTSSGGGGLFGNTASKPGGLFGNTTTTNVGGSLFGNTTTNNTNGSLFGNSNTAASTNKGSSSFSFGNTASTSATGSLFGGAASTPAKSGFSFGK